MTIEDLIDPLEYFLGGQEGDVSAEVLALAFNILSLKYGWGEVLMDEKKVNNLKISKTWCMPNKWTFKIKPIGILVNKYVGNGVGWIDPFAGFNSPAEITNDLNPESPAQYHIDALDFMKGIETNSKIGVIFDPPYSFKALLRCYGSIGKKSVWGEHSSFWSKCKDEITRILRKDGTCISFGWNTCGIGKTRGFQQTEILVVCHGSRNNDTLVTVEKKGYIKEVGNG